MFSFVQMGKDPPLYDETDKSYRQRSQDQPHPETGCAASEPFGNAKGDKSTDHIERAVGNVRNSEHPENEGQAGCDDKQNGRAAQAYKDLA